MSAWTFRRRHGACSGCERVFEDGESHHSALSIEADELTREDLCPACWQARGLPDGLEGEQGPRALFWWRTRHRAGHKRGLALDYEAIEALFLGLEGREQQHLRELRYVLALLLMRKRRLKIERIVRDAQGEAMIVRRPRRKESLRVFVYEFDAERMDALREELRRIFDGGDDALDQAGNDADTIPGDEENDLESGAEGEPESRESGCAAGTPTPGVEPSAPRSNG